MPRTLDDHLSGPGPKRILSIDGGGVRGLVTLGMLKRVESILARRSEDPATFRLCDYFDLIGGTSTGAIIATLLAIGKRVDEVTALYFALCPRVFGRRNLLSYVFAQPKFDSTALETAIEETFDQILIDLGRADLLKQQQPLHEEPALGTDLLRTGLALVTKRIDTASVWVLTNNPRAKFWDYDNPQWVDVYQRELRDSELKFHPNRDYSLRRLVRASASAPYYLDAVPIAIDEARTGLFLDGGASPFNNPAPELFLMTTIKARSDGGNGKGLSPFGFGWDQGDRNLLMLSLGTGTWQVNRKHRDYTRQSELRKALDALCSIISDAEESGVVWMQAISAPRMGTHINANLGDMRGLTLVQDPLLTFRRVSPRLEPQWIERELGPDFKFSERELERMRAFDWAHQRNLERLHAFGERTGERLFSEEDFPDYFDIAASSGGNTGRTASP